MKGFHTSAAAGQHSDGWQFWVDRGGTFTDLVARDPAGQIHTHKLLSADPDRYADATLAGIADLLQVPRNAPLPATRISEVRVGTTVATNALLTRRGARTALVITAGFTDALTIGFQNRPRIFDRRIRRPDPLSERVIAMSERVGAAGEVRCAPDLASLSSAGRSRRAWSPWRWSACMRIATRPTSRRSPVWPARWDSPRSRAPRKWRQCANS